MEATTTTETEELIGLARLYDEAAWHEAQGTIFTVSVSPTSIASFGGGEECWSDVLDWFTLREDGEWVYGEDDNGREWLIEF